MVKPLTFKGDKKTKKRKRIDTEEKFGDSRADAVYSKPDRDAAEVEDDSWVSAENDTDLIGPVVFVLPSEPPTCIASDPTGKVFTSALENIIDGDPSTAEPHDVRQVWVANRISGTDTFSFKGHHGKYVIGPLEIPKNCADRPQIFELRQIRHVISYDRSHIPARNIPLYSNS